MRRLLPTTVLLVLASAPCFGDGLPQKLDRAIAKVQQRPLIAPRDTPWVVMHAVIAFEKAVGVRPNADAEPMGAIDYLCNQARYENKLIFRNRNGSPALPTRDLSYGMRESFKIQDHVDQFLMAFADADVPLTQKLTANDGTAFAVADMLKAAQTDFKPNQEIGWTLVAFTHYLGPKATWKNAAGTEYDMAKLIAIAAARDTNRETEGGPHHLYGVAYALNAHLAAGGKLQGPWAKARAYLDKHAAKAKAYQQKDGSFSVRMFRGSAMARTPRHLVWATGHTIEWLTLSLTAEQLNEPWVRKAVERLADELNDKPVDLFSMGGLYHAGHALRLYKAKALAQKPS